MKCTLVANGLYIQPNDNGLPRKAEIRPPNDRMTQKLKETLKTLQQMHSTKD